MTYQNLKIIPTAVGIPKLCPATVRDQRERIRLRGSRVLQTEDSQPGSRLSSCGQTGSGKSSLTAFGDFRDILIFDFCIKAFKSGWSSGAVPKSGFTLLETVIALGVILGGIIGPYTLATRGVIASGSSKEKLIALNLAQEGIELVRHLRDNNIVAGRSPWTKGISPAPGSDGQQCQDVGWQIGVVGGDGQSLGTLSCYSEQPLYYHRTLSLYNNAQIQGVPSEASVYKRRIDIKHPLEASDPNSFQGVSASKQMLIRSTVEWQHRSVTQSVTLEEVIFDWQ